VTYNATAETEAFVQELIEAAADLRMPELVAARWRGALYEMHDRHGITTIAAPTAALEERQVLTLLSYRLAQYLAIGFVSPWVAYAHKLRHEPRSKIAEDDIHMISLDSATGEILCYAVLQTLRHWHRGRQTTIGDHDRPLFMVEEVFGSGIFDGLRVLPTLPVLRVREGGRFVKNQILHRQDERAIRSPIETFLAMLRVLLGPLRAQVDAIVGDIEEHVVGRVLDYFHVPWVVVREALPSVRLDTYLGSVYQRGVRFPLAFHVGDLQPRRLERIEHALALPGGNGVRALQALKADAGAPESRLLHDSQRREFRDSARPMSIAHGANLAA
jgi:hypothetical protein